MLPLIINGLVLVIIGLFAYTITRRSELKEARYRDLQMTWKEAYLNRTLWIRANKHLENAYTHEKYLTLWKIEIAAEEALGTDLQSLSGFKSEQGRYKKKRRWKDKKRT